MRTVLNSPRSIRTVRPALMFCLLMSLAGCCRTSGWVMNNSGMGYYQKGNYSMARGEFERAVIDQPYNPDFRHNLAMAMQKQGDVQGAEQVLRHNLTIGTMHQPTYHALTQILVSQQRTGEAELLLTEWKDTQPYLAEPYIEQAWFQHETGNKVAAEQSLQQALQIKPNNPVALAQLGQLYHETGQTGQAASYYQRSLQARWNQPEVKSRLATVTGRSTTNMSRSALMQNDANVVLASNPMPMGGAQPMIVQNVNMPSTEMVAFDGGSPRRQRQRHQHAHRHGPTEQLAAYPLPNYGVADLGMQSGMMTAGMPISQPTIVSSPTLMPDMATGQPVLLPPQAATSPTPLTEADPAHATGSLAGLPVVDPH